MSNTSVVRDYFSRLAMELDKTNIVSSKHKEDHKKLMEEFNGLQVVKQVGLQEGHGRVQRTSGMHTRRTTRSTWRSSTCCRYLYKEHMEEFNMLQVFIQGAHGGVQRAAGIYTRST
jgi:hypothetical protein